MFFLESFIIAKKSKTEITAGFFPTNALYYNIYYFYHDKKDASQLQNEAST